MRTALAFLSVACCLLSGCGEGGLASPDRLSVVSVGFRRGLSSSHVLQVGNLSAEQGVEVRVHVFNGKKSADSAAFVIPSGGKRDFGMLEMGWNFAPGDCGCVTVESHPTKTYFAILPDGQYAVLYSKDELTDAELAKIDFSKAARAVR